MRALPHSAEKRGGLHGAHPRPCEAGTEVPGVDPNSTQPPPPRLVR